jgi:hypothetical protein
MHNVVAVQRSCPIQLLEVRDRLDVDLLRIVTGVALVYIRFPSKRQVGIGEGHATYWKPVEN